MVTSFGPHQLTGFRVWAYETEADSLPGAITDTAGATGATFMSFFASPNRYPTRGARLMIHERSWTRPWR